MVLLTYESDLPCPQVNCLCPGHENSDMTDEEAATTFRESKTDDPRAEVVYQRTCTCEWE